MTKNDEYVVDIIDYGMDGEGIAKIDNIIVFVQGALKNERCKIHNKSFKELCICESK